MKKYNLIQATSSRGGRAAFTIVEVMVSTALVVLIMGILVQAVDGTQKVWSRGRAKISQFQSARNSFESITRQLSQATLNTYYDIEYKNAGGVGFTQNDPVNFFRQSELHFVSGKSAGSKLLEGPKEIYPTHCAFFQTPIGYSSPFTRDLGKTANKSSNRELNSLLSAVGYFVKWGDDEDVPKFIKDMPSRAKVNRFRLWQVQSPSEGLGLFTNNFETKNTPPELQKTTGWLKLAAFLKPNSPLNNTYYNVPPRTLADNVVALVLIPKLPVQERSSPDILDLAPDYEYDTRPAKADGSPMAKADITAAGSVTLRTQHNQLPPIVQVTMVAIDEASAARMQEFYGDNPPPLTSGLFERIRNVQDFEKDLGTAAGSADGSESNSLVDRLLRGIDSEHPWLLSYRIYTADVVLRGSKWSRDEKGNF